MAHAEDVRPHIEVRGRGCAGWTGLAQPWARAQVHRAPQSGACGPHATCPASTGHDWLTLPAPHRTPPTVPPSVQKRYRLRRLVESAFDPEEALAEQEREEAQQAQQLASPVQQG